MLGSWKAGKPKAFKPPSLPAFRLSSLQAFRPPSLLAFQLQAR